MPWAWQRQTIIKNRVQTDEAASAAVEQGAAVRHIRPETPSPQGACMSGFRSPDVLERRNNAHAVKKAMLANFRSVTQDPARAEQLRAQRGAVAEARAVRMAEREAAKKVREAELAAEAAHAAELAAQAQRDKEQAEALIAAQKAEAAAALAAEQKAERDARYAARKAAKKVRRRGY